jgi:hypothetical protein
MLIRRGEPTDTISDDRLAELFGHHVAQIETWIDEQANIDVVYVDYGQVLERPLDQAQRVNEFLGGSLETDRMAKVVDPGLYRQRQ